MSSRKRFCCKSAANKPHLNSQKKSGSFTAPIIALVIFIGLTIYYSYFHTVDDDIKDLVTVYKSPSCGCCNKWIEHLQENGFKVRSINTSNMNELKKEKNVPLKLSSCHTAVINGYVIEGHVPADDIKNLLSERRNITGLSVPGMPIGSPGMEGARTDHYQVLEFNQHGNTAVANEY